MLHTLAVAMFVFSGVTRTANQAPADTAHCIEAARFLRADVRIHLVIEPDTIDDWRTHKRVSGCKITSAGTTNVGVQAEALRFYERLRAAKWTRTPNPVDSPNEASLRFRWEQSDCLFNFNGEPLLNTEAERVVNEALRLQIGEQRFQMYVMCMPAMPAAIDSGRYNMPNKPSRLTRIRS